MAFQGLRKSHQEDFVFNILVYPCGYFCDDLLFALMTHKNMKERSITNEEGKKLQLYLEMRSNMKNISNNLPEHLNASKEDLVLMLDMLDDFFKDY